MVAAPLGSVAAYHAKHRIQTSRRRLPRIQLSSRLVRMTIRPLRMPLTWLSGSLPTTEWVCGEQDSEGLRFFHLPHPHRERKVHILLRSAHDPLDSLRTSREFYSLLIH